jgi:MFS family permease
MKEFARNLRESRGFRFILNMGVVDFFGDTTYSGGASMNGLFLGSLGASPAFISIAGGMSEFLNYLTRGLSGYIGDRIRRHWLLVFAGYVFNLLAVPAVALAGQWQVAAGLIVIQGLGRGARKPIVEAMLSHTVAEHGRGWVYGVHNALDYAGRTVGPLVVALVLFTNGSIRIGYALLLIPALLGLVSLSIARSRYPAPEELEEQPTATEEGFTPGYWLYLAAGACFAAGLMNFELISFHLSKSGISAPVVPLFLALATTIGAFASLGLGRLYDRIGTLVVLASVFAAAMFSPFVFLLPIYFAFLGMMLWGIGQTTQDMLLKSVVAGILPKGRRNLAFGLYYAGYGVGWAVGSVAAGLLYEQSHVALVILAMGIQLASLPLFMLARRRS